MNRVLYKLCLSLQKFNMYVLYFREIINVLAINRELCFINILELILINSVLNGVLQNFTQTRYFTRLRPGLLI